MISDADLDKLRLDRLDNSATNTKALGLLAQPRASLHQAVELKMHINDILGRDDLQAIRDRIMRLSERSPEFGECWVWRSGRDKPNQYPAMPIGGRPPHGGFFSAAAVSFAVFKLQPVPDDEKFHRHTCDNRKCVNPGHIILGTHQDNVDDMTSRRRHNFGEKNGKVKLTIEQVREIRSDRRRQKDIAAEYDISQASVSFIKNGINWRLVE